GLGSGRSAGRYRQVRQIFYIHRLKQVVTGSRHHKYRKRSDHPGDVVDEDVLRPKYDRRTEDRILQARFLNGPFHARLAPEVPVRRFFRWINDADVNDLSDAGLNRGLNQQQQVADSDIIVQMPAREANPIRIVESIGAPQALNQAVRPLKIVW